VIAVAENNASLLHGNLDFSLFKCQVPAKLIPVGERLSTHKRETAERAPFMLSLGDLPFSWRPFFPVPRPAHMIVLARALGVQRDRKVAKERRIARSGWRL
jgi:hypothetical protein